MKPHSDRKRTWLVLAVLGGLAVSYGHFFYVPGSRQIAEMTSKLAEAEVEASEAVPLVAALSATRQQLEKVNRYVGTWRAAAPSEHELAELFERIHELTRLADTETTRFEPQAAVAYETFVCIPVSMECQGSFSNLAVVLSGLEAMQEPIWVTSVEIRASGEDGEFARAEITLDVFADNPEDSDQEDLSGKPITQEADRSSGQL